MKESFLKKSYRYITEEYDFFANLSFGLRLFVVLALLLLYFTLFIITQLTVQPYILDVAKTSAILFPIYIIILILATLTILPILFPKLSRKSSLATFVIFSLTSFPFVLFAFLMPRLRKYKTVIKGIVVYLSIGILGLVLIFAGFDEGILAQKPDATSIVYWFMGLVSIFFSIFIYGYVAEKISVEKTRIETEVKIARDIQSQLVPLVEFSGKGYEVFGKMNSAYQIGGDFFDFVEISDEKFVVAIGDVSGHNIAAGLLMAITKGAFRTALQHTSSSEELVEAMNHTIMSNSDKKMFVSFKCAVIDMTNNDITVVNAGHLPLLHYSHQSKKVQEYNQFGLALGLSDEEKYNDQKISFNKGDLFFLITDGIVEALNPAGEEFGFNRLTNLIESSAVENELKHIYEKLMSGLTEFTGTSAFKDDATFLSIKVT